MHESAVDLSEVVLERAGQRESYIDDLVATQRQEVVLEVLIEQVLCLIHDLFAHQDVQLAALVSRLLSVTEVVLDDLDDRSLLVLVLIELVQDGSQGSGCSVRYCGDSVLAELEEHGQELRVDNLLVKEGGKLAKVLRQHLLGAPVSSCLIKGLCDVLDVVLTL